MEGRAGVNALVVDASVLHDHLMDRLDPAVMSRLERSTWYAPELVRFETANAARRWSRTAGSMAGQTFIDDLLEAPIVLVGFEAFGPRAWELRANLTMYDASYVALAELVDAPLVTKDARIARAPGIRCEVRVLS